MNIKNKIVTIILTYNEEKNINRSIKSAKKISNTVYVVDSFSNDKTIMIAKKLNAKILKKKFTSHSEQFNWALKKIKPENKWVLRLDADEYLEHDLINEIKNKIGNLEQDINGITFRLKEKFLGKFIRFGGRRNLRILRLWKYGTGIIENRLMDEGVYLYNGRIEHFNNFIVNNNSQNIKEYILKHQTYASKEAIEVIDKKYKILKKNKLEKFNIDYKRKFKIFIKEKIYYNIPYPVASSLYFIFRYFILFGFLDGKKGFVYHFLQGFWYRVMVGEKVEQIKNSLKKIKSKEKIKKKIYSLTNIKI